MAPIPRDITDMAAELHADLTRLLHEAEAYGDDPAALDPVRALIGEVADLANTPEARGKITVLQEPREPRPGPRYLIDLVTDCHEQLATLINAMHTAGVAVTALAPLIQGAALLEHTFHTLGTSGNAEALRAVDEDDTASRMDATTPHGMSPGERPNALDYAGQHLALALARRNRGMPETKPTAGDQVAEHFMALGDRSREADQGRGKAVSAARQPKPHTGPKPYTPKAEHRQKTPRPASAYSKNASER